MQCYRRQRGCLLLATFVLLAAALLVNGGIEEYFKPLNADTVGPAGVHRSSSSSRREWFTAGAHDIAPPTLGDGLSAGLDISVRSDAPGAAPPSYSVRIDRTLPRFELNASGSY
jgi:hypothetical protein